MNCHYSTDGGCGQCRYELLKESTLSKLSVHDILSIIEEIVLTSEYNRKLICFDDPNVSCKTRPIITVENTKQYCNSFTMNKMRLQDIINAFVYTNEQKVVNNKVVLKMLYESIPEARDVGDLCKLVKNARSAV